MKIGHLVHEVDSVYFMDETLLKFQLALVSVLAFLHQGTQEPNLQHEIVNDDFQLHMFFEYR